MKSSKKTLLEVALSTITTARASVGVHRARFPLALAFARGEVRAEQVAAALGCARTNIYSALSSTMIAAVREGWLVEAVKP